MHVCVGEGDLICSMCYKYFSQLLQSGVCMLSSDDIIYKLRTKRSQLNDTPENFVCTTPNCHVMLIMYKTAFHVCEGLLHNQAFLFPSVYWFSPFIDINLLSRAFLRPLISNSSRVRRKGLGTRLLALIALSLSNLLLYRSSLRLRTKTGRH